MALLDPESDNTSQFVGRLGAGGVRGGGYSLQVGRESNGGHEVWSFLDLAAETEDGVLLEALADVQDVLVLERDKAHLLQPPLSCLFYQTHHGLRGNRDKNK